MSAPVFSSSVFLCFFSYSFLFFFFPSVYFGSSAGSRRHVLGKI